MPQQAISQGLDFVPAMPDYKAFAKTGYHFAIRYVVPSIPGKMVGAAEIASAHSFGVDVGFVYETSGTTWQGGSAAGDADGTAARDAMSSIHVPAGCVCYHAVDSQVPDSELSIVLDWVSGLVAKMPPYHVGIYGQYSVMRAVHAAYPTMPLWQTPAWSNGLVFSPLTLWQGQQATINGITGDVDLLYVKEWGQWSATSNQPPPVIPGKEIRVFIVHVTGESAVYLYDGELKHITSPANLAEFAKVLPSVTIDAAQLAVLAGEVTA